MSRHNVRIPAHEFIDRLSEGAEQAYFMSYKNPFALTFLYYTEGMSTIEIADTLGCEQRTIRRYMNYYGFKRYTKKFALLVKYHGVKGALKIQTPEFYSLGIYND